MSLVIWTSADAQTIRKIFGPIVSRQKIEHYVESDMSTFPTLKEGDTLLACGSRALEVLSAAGISPKNRTISSLRDGALLSPGKRLFLTFDPSIVAKDYTKLPEIQWDCMLAIRRHETGSVRPAIGVYRYVESLHELIEEVDRRYAATGKPVVIAADLETLGLDEYDPEAWIIAAAFTIDVGKADVVYFEKGEAPRCPAPFLELEECDYWGQLWTQLEWLFTSTKVSLRGANFKFDSRWIHRKWGIDVCNLKMDTFLVGALLDENRSNSLKLHAKLYTPLGGYEDDMKDKYDMGRVDLVPKPELLPYVGGDTDATLQVSNVFKDELLKDDRLAKFYVTILHPSSKTFEHMERTGILVDLPYYHRLQEELTVEIARLDVAMKKMIPNSLKAKYSDNFSLTRPALLKDFLFTKQGLNLKPHMFSEKTQAPSTSIDHLLTFDKDPVAQSFIALMKESNSASKTLSTFVVGFLKHLRSDGRFHANYFLARGTSEGSSKDSGTVTGRSSASNPAVQCLRGDALVTTDKGLIAISCIVDRVERGELFKVLTHIGAWRRVVGVYRNGVKPVFSVSSERGTLVSTANHPYLTDRGWVRTDQLQVGDNCYAIPKAAGSPHPGDKATDLALLGGGEEGLPANPKWFQTARIESIEAAGDAETFDLTIEGSHSFVANGFVVHNTIPKHTKWSKRLRRAFIPPPGKVILQIDYSQGELKIAACLADEPVMIQAYKNGADLHSITAAQLSFLSYPEFMALDDDTRDALRSAGKAGNFGLLYGMQSTGFRDYAQASYGVSMTEPEAVEKRSAFFDLYSRLLPWHEECKNIARRTGQIRSPLGRVRHLPSITSSDREARSGAERQAINSPVQSCLSDMMQFAMVRIVQQYGHSGDVQMFMMCHDACAFYVPEGDATIWAKRLKGIMDDLPLKEVFGWDHQLRFTTDAEVSVPDSDGVLSFANLKKLKGL